VALAGCGRSGFDPIDGDTQPPPNDASSGCWSAWTAGPLRLSPPQRVGELAAAEAQGDPSLSPDGLSLYFSRGASGKDYYVARRPDRASPWGTPIRLDDLSSAQDDTKLSLTDDGLVAILSSNRSPATSFDLWEARRTSSSVPFGTATRTPLAAINDNSAQFDPHVSADGLRLYYAPELAGVQRIQLATRDSREEAFGAPAALAVGPYTADPSPSPDELVLVYASFATTPTAMFYTARTSTSEPFSPGQKLPVYDVPVHDQDPAISHDGCELYFASMRAGPQMQLYVAAVL
jgi:Tol biopolymer transport system component